MSISVPISPQSQADVGEVAAECAVCPHPWSFHDQIAARYCTATVASGASRGCVCTAYPAGS